MEIQPRREASCSDSLLSESPPPLDATREERVARCSLASFACLALAIATGAIAYFAFSISPPLAAAALVICAVSGWFGFIQFVNRAATFFPRPLAQLVHWVHAMSFESLALLAVALLHGGGWLLNHRIGIGPTQGRPILLVHGYLHNCSAWIFIRRRLLKAGFGPIYILNLRYPFSSIRNYAEEIAQKAEQIAQETHRSDLILIGHSMGGLICAWYATKIAPLKTVTDVVTIGSPLAGTHLARLAFGLNGREMRRDSALLQELGAEIQRHPARFYHIASKTDQLVLPASSALLGDRLDRQLDLEDIGHVSLLFSSRVTRQISRWLKETVHPAN